jgi:ATP-binding cassette subfamily F protein uup
MPLVSIQELSIQFRGPPLLRSADCQIETGQRIGLLGRNGCGKTTLLKIIHGQTEPDSGKIVFAPGTRVSFLPQDIPESIEGSVFDVVMSGLKAVEMQPPEPVWQQEHRVDQVLSRVGLDAEAAFETLSAGMKRRVLLARALVVQPDLLLLDEPTNHLDIDAITWLEEFLLRWNATLMFVTHDRVFLQKLATRILEIDREQLFDWSCDYATFLKRKEEVLAAQERRDALFDKKLAEEEAWIRTGIKARRTRNEGRVRALEKMREARRQRPRSNQKVQLRIDAGQRSGNLVAELDKVSFGYNDQPIIANFSTTVMRGDKVGIIGPNGAGKSTLLKLLLGHLLPDQGNIRAGTNLQVAYFDQTRAQLDGERSVQENVGDGYDTVRVGGTSRHIIGYLQEFLFTPERARTPVSFLSGGERNRVLLAKLFAKPANVIVLDEPTNDLDTETLELLEERLVDYEGTVFLVSHDRAFLNNIVTSTIVFEDNTVREYFGGYDDWLRVRSDRLRREQDSLAEKGEKGKPGKKPQPGQAPHATATPRSTTSPAAKRRLNYREQQELKALPEAIEALEKEIDQLHQAMADPAFYQQPGSQIAEEQSRLKQLEDQLASTYERWEALEERNG